MNDSSLHVNLPFQWCAIDTWLTSSDIRIRKHDWNITVCFFNGWLCFNTCNMSVEVCISEWGSATLYRVFSFIWGYTTQPYKGKGARVKNTLQIHWKYGMWCVCAFPEPNTVWLKEEFMKYALKWVSSITSSFCSFTSYFDVVRVTHRHFQSCLLHGGFAANEQSK